jgi:hypothetical protein
MGRLAVQRQPGGSQALIRGHELPGQAHVPQDKSHQYDPAAPAATFCSMPSVWPRLHVKKDIAHDASGSMSHQRMVVASKKTKQDEQEPEHAGTWVMRENEPQGQPHFDRT